MSDHKAELIEELRSSCKELESQLEAKKEEVQEVLSIAYKDREFMHKKIEALQELTDHINKVWADTYPDAVDATTMLALKNRVKNLAEDRACWVFNAKVLQNKLNAMENK